jgi:hypothetical protein
MDHEASISMTDCIQPGAITDDDLIAYAANEAPRRVRDHVRACPRCAALAAAYGRAEDRFGRLLFRTDCPSAQELGEYALALLPEATRRRLDLHLTRCPHCEAELATARGFLDTATPVEVGTPGVVSALVRLRRVVAELLAPPARPAVALRGRGRAITLVYTAEDLTLTLHPQLADKPRNHLQVLGFVERRDVPLDGLAGAPVRLTIGGEAIVATTVDEIGNFILGPVPADQYDLELTVDDRLIVAPGLDLAGG